MDFKVYKRSGKKYKRYSLQEAINKGYIIIDEHCLSPRDSTVILLEAIDFFDAHKNLLYVADCVVVNNQMYTVLWNEDKCMYGLAFDNTFMGITPELSDIMALAGSMYDGVMEHIHQSIVLPNKNRHKKGKEQFSVTTLLSNYNYD